MDVAKLPGHAGPPAMVVTPCERSRGVDVLGLRAPAEAVAVSLMNGVTTITPLVRYIAARAWTLWRYVELQGNDDVPSVKRFARKVEAALAASNALRETPAVGAVGGRFVKALFVEGQESVRIKRLTQAMVLDNYAGPSQDLGISWRRRGSPGLTTERGTPLANAAAKTLDALACPASIGLLADEEEVSLDDLRALGEAYPLDGPTGDERELLIDAIMPESPRAEDRSRLAAYCLILMVWKRLGHPPTEDEVLMMATAPDSGDWPAALHGILDGWLRFAVRDMLVAVHERAVQEALKLVVKISGSGVSPIELVLKEVKDADLSAPLVQVGLSKLHGGLAIHELVRAIEDATPSHSTRHGVSRWDGGLDELAIIRALRVSADTGVAVLLPAAWVLVLRRMRAGLEAGLAQFDLSGGPGLARIGAAQVVLPEVEGWRDSGETISDVAAQLVARSVQQHVRIAWSRMQADPSRDIAVIGSDGIEWSSEGTLNPGRATSRIYQAVEWLKQLRLGDDSGPTPDGAAILERSLKTLTGTASP